MLLKMNMLSESFKSMCVKMGEGGGGRLFRIIGTCVKMCENTATYIMLTQFNFNHLSALYVDLELYK